MNVIFDQKQGKEDRFYNYHKALERLNHNGYSYGSMQHPAPTGILRGNFCISKRRNLSEKDKKELDGKLITISGKKNGYKIILF